MITKNVPKVYIDESEGDYDPIHPTAHLQPEIASSLQDLVSVMARPKPSYELQVTRRDENGNIVTARLSVVR